MRLVYKFRAPLLPEVAQMMKVSNNIYNQALYIFRQKLEKDNIYTGYYDMDKIIKLETNLEGDINYRLLKAQCSQQILKVLDKSLKGYFKSIKEWKKHPGKYKAIPHIPNYRKRGGLFNLYYPNQSSKIKDGNIILSKEIQIAIPQWDKMKEKLQQFKQIRLLPDRNMMFVEIVYEHDYKKADGTDKSKHAAIDLGIDNIATMITEDGTYLYNGKPLKAYNQFFNKRIAKLRSIKDKQGIKVNTKMIDTLFEKRNAYMKDFMHKVSRDIVNKLIEMKIGTLVVGYNKGWKDESNIGKVNNQKFVQIPFARLSDFLKYKCEMVGIEFIMNEESYTSKCDALAKEEIKKHDDYLGKRVRRGLFQSSTGKTINADVNGALNILRKAVGDSEITSKIAGSGRLFRPVRCNIMSNHCV